MNSSSFPLSAAATNFRMNLMYFTYKEKYIFRYDSLRIKFLEEQVLYSPN